MAAQLLVFVCLAVVASVFAAPKPIGSLISPCSFKDPALNECMTRQANALMPRIAAGVKEWGLPPLDPLVAKKIVLTNSGNKAVNLELAGFNFTFEGFKDNVIESVKFDPRTLHLEVLVRVPRFSGHGQYKINGHLLVLALVGEGHSEFVYDTVHMLVIMDFKRVEKGGKEFLKLDKVYYDLKSVVKAMSRFDNLFGNKQLSDTMNKVLNDNSQAVLRELKPAVAVAFAELLNILFEPMFDRIPLSQLFKDTD